MKKDKAVLFRIIKNKIFEGVIFIFASALIIPLFLIIFMILQKGLSVINWHFIFDERRLMGSSTGGIFKDIVGSLIIISLTVLFSVPVGISSGLYLVENRKSKIAFFVQWCIDILQGVPSIVIGLIVSLWVVKSKILGPSALAGGLALACMMLPVVIKSTEETVRLIPDMYKEASLALGVPYYRTILKVILPSSLSGIITGVLLGIGRIAGETAPLIFTAFGNNFMNTNVLKPTNTLPQLIYSYSMDASKNSNTTAWGASFVLIAIILIINLISKLVVKRWKIRF